MLNNVVCLLYLVSLGCVVAEIFGKCPPYVATLFLVVAGLVTCLGH